MNRVGLHQTPPMGYTPAQQSAAFNQRFADALSAGDIRYQMKELDRAGMSRGAGQRNAAGITAANQMAQGIADAYKGEYDDRLYNENLSLDNAIRSERQAQALAGLQQQDSYAQQMAALQRQQAMLNFTGSLLGGLLG